MDVFVEKIKGKFVSVIVVNVKMGEILVMSQCFIYNFFIFKGYDKKNLGIYNILLYDNFFEFGLIMKVMILVFVIDFKYFNFIEVYNSV